MEDLTFGLEIAVAGMFIVVATLVILSFCIEAAEALIQRVINPKKSAGNNAGGAGAGNTGALAEEEKGSAREGDTNDQELIAAICVAAVAAYKADKGGMPSSMVSIKSIRPLHGSAWRLEGRRQLCHRHASVKN